MAGVGRVRIGTSGRTDLDRRGRFYPAEMPTADRFRFVGRHVFAYFNNDVGGAARDDARDPLDLLAPVTAAAT